MPCLRVYLMEDRTHSDPDEIVCSFNSAQYYPTKYQSKHESRAVRSKCLDSLLDLLLKNFNPKKKKDLLLIGKL